MDQLYGYAGKILRVDLTRGKITEETLDEATARNISWTGLGAKVLYKKFLPRRLVGWRNRLVLRPDSRGTTVELGTVSCDQSALSNEPWRLSQWILWAFLKFSGFDGLLWRKAQSGVSIYS